MALATAVVFTRLRFGERPHPEVNFAVNGTLERGNTLILTSSPELRTLSVRECGTGMLHDPFAKKF